MYSNHFQGNNRNAVNANNNNADGIGGNSSGYNGAHSRLRTQSTYDMSTFRGSRQSITTLYPGRDSSRYVQGVPAGLGP